MCFLERQRLFAFILLIKNRLNNGIIDGSKAKYLIAKSLGISAVAYSKYLSMGIKLGLIRKKSYYLRTIKWRAACKILGLVEKNRKFKRTIDKSDISQMSFTKICSWVYQSLILWNLQQQKHIIEKKKSLVGIANQVLANRVKSGKLPKKLIKAARKENLSTEKYCIGLVENFNSDIVTGSIHLSKKVGLSYRTASRALNKLAAQKFIKRELVIKAHELPINHYSFDYLCSIYNRQSTHYSYYLSKFVTYIGSKITLTR